MIAVERTHDIDVINSVFKHPEIIDLVCDDFTVDVEYPIDDRIIYLAAYEDDKIIGLLMNYAVNGVTNEVHTAFLPGYTGRSAKKAFELCLKWTIDNTEVLKLVARIPAYNTHAINAAKLFGYDHEGTITKTFMKNGKLHDLECYGRGVERCHRQ